MEGMRDRLALDLVVIIVFVFIPIVVSTPVALQILRGTQRAIVTRVTNLDLSVHVSELH